MMLLRGSSLRNTEWVYGVAVYTGHETKIMKNSARPKAKKSMIEKSTGMYILVAVGTQTLLCIIATIYGSIWNNYFGCKDAAYLELDCSANLALEMLVNFGTWFLALMNFVAISMMVTLEMVKFF